MRRGLSLDLAKELDNVAKLGFKSSAVLVTSIEPA